MYFLVLSFWPIQVKMCRQDLDPGPLMSATAQASRPASLNRRRRVRQKVHAPAYATFGGLNNGALLDLNEVLDISEVGAAVQCAAPMKVDQQVNFCLDLAEASGQISATARVVWSDQTGRAGLAFQSLPNSSLRRLREWLFLNAMAGAANAASSSETPAELTTTRPNYSDTLSAASAVQREAESLGDDLEGVLSLIASRSRSLLRASGAAIALAETDTPGKVADIMICRANAGPGAPPVGAALQVGTGFSGECVRTGTISRCPDTDTDERVDPQSCRALGIRSMLAVPVRANEKVIGLLEVFSGQPRAFTENDSAVLQRFAETIVAAMNRSARKIPSPPPPAPAKPFVPRPGSVLFAYPPEESTSKTNKNELRSAHGHDDDQEHDRNKDKDDKDKDKVGGIHLPRTHLYLLVGAAATIFLALGFLLAPWIQEKLKGRDASAEHTVLASSQPPVAISKSDALSVDSANLDQLREMAQSGDSSAEDRLGRLYAEGDDKQGIKPDDTAAAHWFLSAAEHGNVSAQYKVGLLYWGGHHGLPKDLTKAYFWTVLARAGGQESSKDVAKSLANGLTRAQAAAIEQQANIWYQQHASNGKPSPAR
jgi:hypothetical protein